MGFKLFPGSIFVYDQIDSNYIHKALNFAKASVIQFFYREKSVDGQTPSGSDEVWYVYIRTWWLEGYDFPVTELQFGSEKKGWCEWCHD